MKLNRILTKVYGASSVTIVSVITLACILYKWPLVMIAVAMLASMAISSPAAISLHLLVSVFQKRKFEKSFVWMLLLASIPPLAWMAAWAFADWVPGKAWFLLLLGIAGGYAGILINGISVAQFFNSHSNERA